MRLSNLLIILLVMLIGCQHKSTAPQENPPAMQTIAKSAKRGIAYNLIDPTDMDSLKRGVSWWYNWHVKTDAPPDYHKKYQMTFIPMLWGRNSANDYSGIQQFILAHAEIEYLLVLNEPNLLDQANMAPFEAAGEWRRYEQLVKDFANENRIIKLVGPAMNWGTMSNYQDPVDWLDAFYAAYQSTYGREPQIDYLAFHWYDYGLAQQLDRLQKYGKKIWITEMANWNANITSYEKQAEQMREMVAICESRADVFRYAWFIGRGSYPDHKFTYLLNPAAGELSELGKLYLSLPY